MMRSFLRASVAVAAAISAASLGALPACSSSCADVACVRAVTVTLDGAVTMSGDYEIDFVADGTKMTCTVTLPTKVPAKCDDGRAFVSTGGGDAIDFVSLDGKFDTVSVQIFFNGGIFADQTFTPKYQNIAVGGTSCATCPSASVTLTPITSHDVDAGTLDAGSSGASDAGSR